MTTTPNVEAYDSNVRHWLRLCTEEDIRAGRDWYWQAQQLVAAIASDTHVGIPVVAAVVACLSPSVDWPTNVADAHAFCRAYAQGRTDAPSASGYPANRAQAWRILQAQDPAILTGPKRTAFASNLQGNLHVVTVDRWAVRAATLYARERVNTPKQYKAIADAYSQVAAANGLSPAVLQAIVWVCIKRLSDGRRGGEPF